MSKKTFIVFGLLVVFLAVLIPWLAFRADGDSANAEPVPSDLKEGQALFETNCGTCHTLYAAGTDGNYGPDLDELLAASGPLTADSVKSAQGRVETAVEKGVDGETPGRMPAEILNEEQTKEVAEFVANTAGGG
jgi:mono/diheme cytochrome c family protein